MNCSDPNSLSRAFFCHDCSEKDDSILCLNCATFCHLFHLLCEIRDAKTLNLRCQCGVHKDHICLFKPDKPHYLGNTYKYRVLANFDEDHYDRKSNLLYTNGSLYIERAIKLATQNRFLAAMEDINVAATFDAASFIDRISKIDVTSFLHSMSEVKMKFLCSIEKMDNTILESIEVIEEFCNLFQCACERMNNDAPDGLDLLVDSLNEAECEIRKGIWKRAATFDHLFISSEEEFELYRRHVLPKRKKMGRQLPILTLIFEQFTGDPNIEKYIKKVRGLGFECKVRYYKK